MVVSLNVPSTSLMTVLAVFTMEIVESKRVRLCGFAFRETRGKTFPVAQN